MRISFEDVNQFLELNITERHEEINDFLESLMLSRIDCTQENSTEYDVDYFMIYEQNSQVFFNRIRNFLFQIIHFPLKIAHFIDSVGNFMYSIIILTHKITGLLNDEEFRNYSLEMSFYFSEILTELINTLVVFGNWKKLANSYLDSKCLIKEKVFGESVHAFGFHAILSAQNLILYLIYLLSKKIFSCQNSSAAIELDFCSLTQNDTEETSLFSQTILFFINNLFQLSIHNFKKIITDVENLNENYQNLCCECVNKCWYLGYRICHLFEKDCQKIQNLFWTSLSRLIKAYKNSNNEDDVCDQVHKSNKLILIEKEKIDHYSHFTFLLTYRISSVIKNISEKSNQIEPKNYLDPSYQIIKSSIKEIAEQNQNADQNSFNNIRIPLQILCHEMTSNSPHASYIELSQIFSSNPTMSQSSHSSNKIFVDILLMLWESYFSKLINSCFFVQKRGSNSLFALNESQVSLTVFKSGLKIINEITLMQIDQLNNVYHIFLSFLFLKLKEGSSNNTNSSTNQTNLVWRQFKGRLYTRLHDKRIAELDMTGFLNISYMFFILIKCFSNPSDLVTSQLKYEQFENFFRILNVFMQSKNMNKLDHVLSLNNSNVSYTSVVTSSRTNALKTFLNMKFLALKLWFDSAELDSEENLNIDRLVNEEFSVYLNNIVQEAHQSILHDQKSNQISNFKISQLIGQFLSDFFLCFFDNCRDFIAVYDSRKNLYLYQISLIICKLINEIKIEEVFKLLSRKQNEILFSKISEILAIYKSIFQNELSNYAFNTKLSETLSQFLNKLWSILINQQITLNKSSVFSFETMSNFGYQICSLFSKLIYNPSSLVQNTTKEMKVLIDMIENFALTSHIVTNSSHQTSNIEDHCLSSLVRIKFIELVLNDLELEQICEQNLSNFQLKLVNLIFFAFINSSSSPSGPKDFFDLKESNTPQSERVLANMINSCLNKIEIFKDLNLNLNSDVENLLIDFISKYAQKLKNIQSFTEKKKFLENLNIFFNDFLKLVQSITSIASHSILYKTYIIASQIIHHLSPFIHYRGRSDTLFAKIIDKLVLPASGNKNSNPKLNPSNLTHANNQNSILISLKDSLHLFLIGISQLNYEYDGYLQRVLQNIITNFTMKFQMVQVEDHFIVLALEETFNVNCSSEFLHFRTYIIGLLNQIFLKESKNNNEIERSIQIIHFILKKTEQKTVLLKDALPIFSPVLNLISTDCSSLKSKVLNLFTFLIDLSKNNPESDVMFSQSIEEVIRKCWNYQEPNKLFVSLTLIAKQKPCLLTQNIKETILEKVEESQSKFRYNSELKNILYTLFEYIDGDEGKVFLNKRLGFLWY